MSLDIRFGDENLMSGILWGGPLALGGPFYWVSRGFHTMGIMFFYFIHIIISFSFIGRGLLALVPSWPSSFFGQISLCLQMLLVELKIPCDGIYKVCINFWKVPTNAPPPPIPNIHCHFHPVVRKGKKTNSKLQVLMFPECCHSLQWQQLGVAWLL